MELVIVDVKHLPQATSALVLAWYWQQLEEQGLLPALFYDGCIQNSEEFVNFSIDKYTTLFVIYEKYGKFPVAHVHLNGFEGLTCRGHFSVLRTAHGWRRSVEIGTLAGQKILDMKRLNSDLPYTTSIIGLTPVTNRLACRYIEAIGFKPQFELQDACYIKAKDQYTSGLVSILTRETHGQERWWRCKRSGLRSSNESG